MTASGTDVDQLVAVAWDIDEKMISGGPKWIDTDRFDIVARAPSMRAPDRFPPDDTLRPMLRKLLENRFKLTSTTRSSTRAVGISR